MPRSRESGVFTLLDKRMIAFPSTQPLWPFQSLSHMFSFLSRDLKVPIDISSPSVTLLARRKHAEYWGLSLTVLLLLDFTLVIPMICTTGS